MIITIVSDVCGAENNGTSITMKRLVENLKERGHFVKVVSIFDKVERSYYQLPKRSFGIFNNYIARNGVVLAKPDDEILRKAMRGSDVVHIILPFKTGKRALKIARELNIPVTSAFHCQPENITAHLKLQNFTPLNNFIYHYFWHNFYKNVNYIHCPSEFIASQMRKNGYEMDLRVISNGVALEYQKRAEIKDKEYQDKFSILFIGRLSREKRHDILIDAVSLSKYADKIQLWFAGNGPLQKKLEKRSQKLINKPIFGFYSKTELVSIINKCDLYVHPADIEIEAIACLEAITCGLIPIISDSSRSATNAFALHKENLFKAGNPKDLARAIDYMIEHPEVVAKMKDEYLAYSEQFQIARCIDKMEKMFYDAIENATLIEADEPVVAQ